jgi:hypothetical protein
MGSRDWVFKRAKLPGLGHRSEPNAGANPGESRANPGEARVIPGGPGLARGIGKPKGQNYLV